SPTKSVRSIDCEGILKACTTKLVPNNARMTVTSRDSRYSEIVVRFAGASCVSSGSVSPGVTGAAFSDGSVSSGMRFHLFAGVRFHLLQPLQRAACRSLFRFFLRAAFRVGQAFALGPHLYLKCLLVIRPGFPGQSVFRGRFAPAL